MSKKNNEEIITDIYKTLYALSTPPADFDLLVKTSPRNESGQIMIPFNDHEIDENLAEAVINQTLDKSKISKIEKQKIKATIYLGCSPKFKSKIYK